MVAKVTHLLVAQVQELVKLNSAVGEGAERALLLEVGSDLGVGNGGISLFPPAPSDPSKQNTSRQHSPLP